METKKEKLIKMLNLEKENLEGSYKGFFCDGGFYDSPREILYKMGFTTCFYEAWYYEKMTLESENLLFELIEGDIYLFDLNEYDTTLNTDDLNDFYDEIDETKGLEYLNFEEIEEYINFSDDEKEKIKFLLDENLASDFEEAKTKIDEIIVYEDWEQITDEFIETNFYNVPENAKFYLDREAIRRDLEINGSFWEFGNQIFEVAY